MPVEGGNILNNSGSSPSLPRADWSRDESSNNDTSRQHSRSVLSINLGTFQIGEREKWMVHLTIPEIRIIRHFGLPIFVPLVNMFEEQKRASRRVSSGQQGEQNLKQTRGYSPTILSLETNIFLNRCGGPWELERTNPLYGMTNTSARAIQWKRLFFFFFFSFVGFWRGD